MGKRSIIRWIGDIFSGDFITRWRLERYIWFVFYTFWLVCGFIAWNLCVDNKLIKVSENNTRIEKLSARRDQTSLELLELDRKDVVESLLKKNNSKLVAPTEPPAVVKRSGK